MKKEFYKIIPFPFSDTKNGILHMFEHSDKPNSLPFVPKRILVTKGMIDKDERGAHTHHETRQILVCIQGSCKVKLDNGSVKMEVELSKSHEGLLLEPYVWHTVSDFAENTILLVIANTEYDEKDYIRNYDDFMNFIKEKKPW